MWLEWRVRFQLEDRNEKKLGGLNRDLLVERPAEKVSVLEFCSSKKVGHVANFFNIERLCKKP